MNVNVEYNGQTTTLPLIVTRGTGPALLGRNWLKELRLDWKQIFSVQSKHALEDVLLRYEDVFQDELGTVKGVTAKIHIDPATELKFHRV